MVDEVAAHFDCAALDLAVSLDEPTQDVSVLKWVSMAGNVYSVVLLWVALALDP